jgi:hypothetical protein
MEQLTVRLSSSAMARLKVLAEERGQTRAALVRQLVIGAVEGLPVDPADPPSEKELLELLGERARAGNVAAIRALLLREEAEQDDPRQRALNALQILTSERRDN